MSYLLGELMQVVKEFTEVLTREEKRVFPHFSSEERDRFRVYFQQCYMGLHYSIYEDMG